MQTQLYRFEIDHALVNAVYAARDTSDGSAVTIYEWTPPIAERDAARLRLADLQSALHAEVFSLGASLYLTAPTAELIEQSLKELQTHGLFLDFNPEPSQPPPSSTRAPPVLSLPTIKRRSLAATALASRKRMTASASLAPTSDTACAIRVSR